jgi:hypothetical protein
MTSAASWKWDFAVVGSILLIASYLLFVPPFLGVADQGDYNRLLTRVGLSAPSELSYDDRIDCWVVSQWNIVPAQLIRTFSSGEFPVWAAILLHKIASRTTTLDIRWVSGVNLALLSGLILVILRSARKLPAPAYFAIAAGLLLVSTDSQYLSYFNSFYGESAALLGVFAFVAAGLWTITAEDPSWIHMAGLGLAAAFLAGAKAQNAILGLFAAGWIVWLFWTKPALRYLSMLGGLLLMGFTGFVLARAPNPESNLFNAIYDRVLPNSPDPAGSLAELGLNPDTARWSNKTYWELENQLAGVFPGKATRLSLLKYYLRHPRIDLRMAQEALSLSNDVPYLGNYTKDSGAPCFTRTQAFTEYDRFRMRFASLWFLFPLLAANVAAAVIWRNRPAGLLATLGIMAAGAFIIAACYDNDPRKHLFTFNLLFDVLCFADLSVGAAHLTRLHVFEDWGAIRSLKPALVLLLLGILATLGIAVRLDAIYKESPIGSVDNLAVRRPATQSSSLDSASGADAAVDGNTDGNFLHGSVTSTDREPGAWWQVDLGSSKTIGSIAIWNRTDCCSSRLSNYWVFLSDTPFGPSDTPGTIRKRPGTWTSYQIQAPDPVTTMATGGAGGRYVRVQLDGTDYLSLAEVQVLVTGPDLAMRKPAIQSSSLDSVSGADVAVDGNTDGNFLHGSVTSTDRESGAWWQVDLGDSTPVGSIVIWNRTDCCASRLKDYWVFLSDTPFSPGDTPATLQNRSGTWKSHQTVPPGPSATIATGGEKGRYVRVQLNGTDYLSLAEVQVFGR